jgi:uncharacterized OsmC-like protein/ketosteroid isomerase-like protein
MPSDVVRADWLSGNVFLLRDRHGFPVLMTQPDGVQGADLLPLSLIGCSAWDVMGILLKQRQPVTSLAVTGHCERDPDLPARYRAIHIHYAFTGQPNPARVQRAIALSEGKYCSIYATLRETVALTSDFEIHGTDVAAAPPAALNGTDLVLAFNRALNAGDVDAMMARLTDDCVFENTFPAPDGQRFVGQAAVRAFWEEFFRTSGQPHLEFEDVFECGDRAVLRWTYHWLEANGRPGHVRGVDVYRLRGGRIAEKLSYVKG